MAEPAVHFGHRVRIVCVDARYAEDCLTPGKTYMGLPRDLYGLDGFHLVDDSGGEMWWIANRFQVVQPPLTVRSAPNFMRRLFWITAIIFCALAWLLIFKAFIHLINLTTGLLSGAPIDLD